VHLVSITDDTMFVCLLSEADSVVDRVLRRFSRLGVPVQLHKWAKEGSPRVRQIWSGALLDIEARRAEFPAKLIAKAIAALRAVIADDVISVTVLHHAICLVQWLAVMCPLVKCFTYDMRDAVRRAGRDAFVLGSPHLTGEVLTLIDIIEANPGASFSTALRERDSLSPVVQDASDIGAGGYWTIGSMLFWWRIVWTSRERALFPRRTSQRAVGHIGAREFFAINISLDLIMSHVPRVLWFRRLPVFSDSMSSVMTFIALRARRDPVVDALLKRTIISALSGGIELSSFETSHFPGACMPADALSRDGVADFFDELGDAYPIRVHIEVPDSLRRGLVEAASARFPHLV